MRRFACAGAGCGWSTRRSVGTSLAPCSFLPAALAARSVALAGFGLDSLIEIVASLVVVWQLQEIEPVVRRRARPRSTPRPVPMARPARRQLRQLPARPPTSRPPPRPNRRNRTAGRSAALPPGDHLGLRRRGRARARRRGPDLPRDRRALTTHKDEDLAAAVHSRRLPRAHSLGSAHSQLTVERRCDRSARSAHPRTAVA
jgi:hypothetical protein